jgi:putative DNA primase/helicase
MSPLNEQSSPAVGDLGAALQNTNDVVNESQSTVPTAPVKRKPPDRPSATSPALPPLLATCLADMKRDMEANGLHFKGELIADHTLHRYHGEGDSKGSTNIWAIFHPDDHPNGIYGCHKRFGKEGIKWSPAGAVRISAAERKVLIAKMAKDQTKRDDELEAGYEAATKLAQKMLDAAAPATDDHAYLKNKSVKAHAGVKAGTWIKEGKGRPLEIKGALLIPMSVFDNAATEGEDPRPRVSAQAIFASKENPLNRGKDFITGGRKQGAWFAIGRPLDKNGVKIVAICEGYSTGASIFQATGIGAIVAFDRTNLIHVAQAWKNQYPKRGFILAADHDQWTEGNPGLTDATKAAEDIGAPVVRPEFENTDPDPKTGKRPTDFNDLATREGADAVKRRFEPAIAEIVAKAAEAAATTANIVAAFDIDPTDETIGESAPDSADPDTTGTLTVMGYNRGDYFIFVHKKKQVISFKAVALSQVNFLIELTDSLKWWERSFPAEKGSKQTVDLTGVAEWVIRTAHRRGIYDPSKARGRGAWLDDGRIVFHFGNSIMVDGQAMDVTKSNRSSYTSLRANCRPPPRTP